MTVYQNAVCTAIGCFMPTYLQTVYQENYDRAEDHGVPHSAPAITLPPACYEAQIVAAGRGNEGDDANANK